MAEEEKEPEGEGEESGGGGGNALKAILIPVLSSAVTAGLVAFIMLFFLAPKPVQQVATEGDGHGGAAAQGGDEQELDISDGEEAVRIKHTGHYHQYDSFVVSIFDREKVHYLRIKVALELSNPNIAAEIEAKDPQIKDSMIFVLGDFTVRELLDNQAKLLVKEVLLKTLNKILGKGKVIDVYFTEFVVQ